eukprot:m.96720 g.96720  ORF g.96720 m.96720 type:complete len:196 (+) comp13557_c0_seq1:2630-3217(+)
MDLSQCLRACSNILCSCKSIYTFARYAATGDHGMTALQILTSCAENSWCHMLNVNATATMEAWTRAEKPNLSWSHPWATSPSSAIAHGFMGITATSPAYSTWRVQPQPGNATQANMTLPTISGAMKVAFSNSPSSFMISVTAPGNTKGTVCVPMLGISGNTVTVNGKTVQGNVDGDYICVDNLSGDITVMRQGAR